MLAVVGGWVKRHPLQDLGPEMGDGHLPQGGPIPELCGSTQGMILNKVYSTLHAFPVVLSHGVLQ